MKASASILIKSSLNDTFLAFSDVPNRARYLPKISKLTVNSLLIEGKGISWHEERQEDGITKKGTMTISSFNKPRAFTITSHSGGIVFKTRYNFQYAGVNATKVVVSIGGQPKGLLSRFMGKFLSQNSVYMGQQLQNDLDSFKLAIERKDQAS